MPEVAQEPREPLPTPPAEALSELCWLAVCALAEKIRNVDRSPRFCWIGLAPEPAIQLDRLDHGFDGLQLTIVLDGDDEGSLPRPLPIETRYELRNPIKLEEVASGELPAEARRLLTTYLPYCFAALHAKRMNRAFAVSHFAQSLDGRIATADGNSQWIGCPENLQHAHRMRALCDAILIGSRTLERDQPSLTVRHVPGPDPTRVVIGSVTDLPKSLQRASTAPVIHLGHRGIAASDFVQTLAIEPESGRLCTQQILEKLWNLGLSSVYIEGGAETTSRFLEDHCIDVLQLHFSPMIIGPGINSFSRPTIEDIRQSRRFEAHEFVAVGDGMMFVGWAGRAGRAG